MGAGYHGGFGNTLGSNYSDKSSRIKNIGIDDQSSDIGFEHQRESFLRNELSRTSPILIPKCAEIKEYPKARYYQVKFIWRRGDYKYIARWHTRTPNAPINQGSTWVVTRIRNGISNGSDARRRQIYILVGKYKWVSMSEWQDAIKARQYGTSTKAQKEMLNNGHWKS